MTGTKLTVGVTATARIAWDPTMCASAKTALTIAKPAVRHVVTWLNTNTDGLELSRHGMVQTETSSLYSPKTERSREAISPTEQ